MIPPNDPGTGFWIGGFTTTPAAGSTVGWKWSDGTPFDYQNWKSPPQPDNSVTYCQQKGFPNTNQACLAVFTDSRPEKQYWDDNCCPLKQMFVCEKPVDHCVAV